MNSMRKLFVTLFFQIVSRARTKRYFHDTISAARYLHGLTMPTASSDRAINALRHALLLRPTRCPGKGHCKDILSHSARYIEGPTSSDTFIFHGMSRPTRASMCREGPARFISPWKAYDAHLVTFAQRADNKIHQSRRVPTLSDVTGMRQCFLPGTARDTMLQQLLIP